MFVEGVGEIGDVWCYGVASGCCWPAAARRNGAVVAGGSWWLGAVGNVRRDARKVVRLQGVCWVAVITVGWLTEGIAGDGFKWTVAVRRG